MLLQVCDKSHNGGPDELPSEEACPNAEAFLEHCERISMKSTASVFRQGDPSEDLYLILDGSVSVIVDDIEDPEQEMVVS
jgi:CRP/FNR family cyclic AMP-dependent transcriptional regulator